jgi:hypothetical protein
MGDRCCWVIRGGARPWFSYGCAMYVCTAYRLGPPYEIQTMGFQSPLPSAVLPWPSLGPLLVALSYLFEAGLGLLTMPVVLVLDGAGGAFCVRASRTGKLRDQYIMTTVIMAVISISIILIARCYTSCGQYGATAPHAIDSSPSLLPGSTFSMHSLPLTSDVDPGGWHDASM